MPRWEVGTGEIMESLRSAADEIEVQLRERPRVALLLAGGFQGLRDICEVEKEVTLGKDLLFGTVDRLPVAVVQRPRATPDDSSSRAGLSLRLLRLVGVDTLIVTGSGTAVGPELESGDLLLIEDQINLGGTNPLVGPNLDGFGPRFPDMTEAFDPFLREVALEAAGRLGIRLTRGVYAEIAPERWTDGGSGFDGAEAEFELIRRAGANLVGSGIVPDVIVARHMGMRVLGIASVDLASSGAERQGRGGESAEMGIPLIREIVKELGRER